MMRELRTWARARFSCDSAKDLVLAVEKPCSVKCWVEDVLNGEVRRDGWKEELWGTVVSYRRSVERQEKGRTEIAPIFQKL